MIDAIPSDREPQRAFGARLVCMSCGRIAAAPPDDGVCPRCGEIESYTTEAESRAVELRDLVEEKAKRRLETLERERVERSHQAWAISEWLRAVRGARLTGDPEREARALQELAKLI